MQAPPLLGRVFCHTMKLFCHTMKHFWLLIIVIVKNEICFGKLLKILDNINKIIFLKKVQVGIDQEKAQSEKKQHSHYKNRGGKKNQTNNRVP